MGDEKADLSKREALLKQLICIGCRHEGKGSALPEAAPL